VFAIAGPAMVANLDHAADRHRLDHGDRPARRRHFARGVTMASVLFDCMFWLFAFLRMSTSPSRRSRWAPRDQRIAAILVRGSSSRR